MPLHNHSFILLRSPLQDFTQAYKPKPGNALTPIFKEGLYLSSPAYWQELQKQASLTGKNKDKLDRTFAKYWIRSCMRSTPYGTFAGSAIVNMEAAETQIILDKSSSHLRRLRVDMNYMTGLITALTTHPAILKQLKFYPNNSIYEVPNGFRYAEYTLTDDSRNYQLTSISNAAYIKAILKSAAAGATIAELGHLLAEEEGVSAGDAETFIKEMYESQLLVSALEPCVTGKEPLDELIEQLESLQDVAQILTGLKNIQQLIRIPEDGVAYYQNIEDALKKLDISIGLPKNILQTDLFLGMHQARISKDLVSAIIEQAGDLLMLAKENRSSELEDFKKRFHTRYEEAEVPLAIALDADLGIGYAGVRDERAGGSDWVDDLVTGATQATGSRPDENYLEQFALIKYHNYLKEGKQGIELTEEELKGFKKQVASFNFSNSLFLMGSLLKKEGRLDKTHFVFDIASMGGPSAGNLLGRFTHGDERLAQLTREMLAAEETEYPDAIYAEIAHLPQARIGNILLRPVLRKYEIPYVGKSGAPAENQILIEDLMVSVRSNELILRSRKHNKRVIPRLTTAHNFSHRSLPVYKFLCDLQSQGIAYPNVWDWGSLAHLNHLPRVSYKNLILQKARWKITEKDIDGLPKEVAGQASYFKAFRDKHGLPQRVVYAEADNELLIDFGEETGIDLFLHYLKRHKNILLEEFLFTEDNCMVQDVEGRPYTNEIIIPLYREAVQIASLTATAKSNVQLLKRKFAPNSEWQYFKVYCGSKTAEKILSETVLPFIEQGIEEKLFERFFFIRYRDEGGHFRIRFYNADTHRQAFVQTAFMQVLQPLIDKGTIEKVMLDTYTREVERYNEDLIEEAEALFHSDSLAVLRFISLLDNTDSEKYRMLFALRGIDMLLDDFGLSLAQKHRLLKTMQESFFKEFGGSPVLQKQLNEKYRKHQPDIFSHLIPDNDLTNEIDEAVAVFEIRSEMNEDIIKAIKIKLEVRDNADMLDELLPSYMHMFINRLFIAQQRKYELVVYHFLEKYYASRLAIGKNKMPLIGIQYQPI